MQKLRHDDVTEAKAIRKKLIHKYMEDILLIISWQKSLKLLYTLQTYKDASIKKVA